MAANQIKKATNTSTTQSSNQSDHHAKQYMHQGIHGMTIPTHKRNTASTHKSIKANTHQVINTQENKTMHTYINHAMGKCTTNAWEDTQATWEAGRIQEGKQPCKTYETESRAQESKPWVGEYIQHNINAE